MKKKFELNWTPHPEELATFENVASKMRGYGLSAAPLVFSWLEWCTILALLHYAENKTHLLALSIARWILAIFLWWYMSSVLTPPKTKWLSRDEMLSWRTVGIFFGSFLLTATFVYASSWLANVFMTYPLG